MPVVGDRQVVTTGLHIADGNPPIVNEPQVLPIEVVRMIDIDCNGTLDEVLVPGLLCMWQVGDVPGVNQVEVPVRLEYKIGLFDIHIPCIENDPFGDLIWEAEKIVPMPMNALDARDPALARFDDDVTGDRFIAGAGVYTNDSIDFESYPFVTYSDGYGEDLLNPDDLGGHEVAWIRAADESSNSGTGIGDNDLYIIGTSLENTQLIDRAQVALRRTLDGGLTWGPWEGLETSPNNAALGFPSHLSRHGNGDMVFAYMDDQAQYLRVMNGMWDLGMVNFGGISLNQSTNMVLGANDPDYFAASKNYLAGNFTIGPFADIGTITDSVIASDRTAYIVYHDLAGNPQGNDADFDVFIVRGVWNGSDWDWSQPFRINRDSAHVRSDQFMPAIHVSDKNQVHVAWYDTRHNKRAPGQDVTIALYYAYLEYNETTQSFDVTELIADQEAIKTGHLNNPNTIGDRIDITRNPFSPGVVIVYTGTAHPRQQDPGGIEPLGGGIQTPQDDEMILSVRIDFITP